MNTWARYVHTIGDSTLDNLWWQSAQEEDSVEGLLKNKLGGQYEIISHAFDGFTTQDVLEGGVVGSVFGGETDKKSWYLRAKHIEPTSDRKVYPLKRLRAEIDKQPQSIHHVVISVGGNDFRVLRPQDLLQLSKIRSRYLQIVKTIQTMGRGISASGGEVRPILMLQYRPDAHSKAYPIYPACSVVGDILIGINILATVILAANIVYASRRVSLLSVCAIFGSTLALSLTNEIIPYESVSALWKKQNFGVTMLGYMMERFYRPILQHAEKEGIPVLDLSNCFNPFETQLYHTGIEPSKEGGEKISEGLARIIQKELRPEQNSLMLHDCEGGVKKMESHLWRVVYPSTSGE